MLSNCKCGTSGVNDVAPDCPVHGKIAYKDEWPNQPKPREPMPAVLADRLRKASADGVGSIALAHIELAYGEGQLAGMDRAIATMEQSFKDQRS